ncbi:MAG: J domain-containing protein [Acidimicrobiales bacterium]
MTETDPYEVLGVAPTASPEEIRRAYLALARSWHPDLQPGEARVAAEERMRRINAAWAILGDEARRARFDRERERAAPPGPSHGGASPGFRPIAEDDTDYAALLDELPVTGSTIPRLVQVLPAMLCMAGVLALICGFVASFPPLLALGAIGVVAGLVAFVAVPALAVVRSYRDELD